MKNIKHHLIGFLESGCITYNVIDYRNAAVQLVSIIVLCYIINLTFYIWFR